jgi:hypothetical protein
MTILQASRVYYPTEASSPEQGSERTPLLRSHALTSTQDACDPRNFITKSIHMDLDMPQSLQRWRF